jgi:hypothetical protein
MTIPISTFLIMSGSEEDQEIQNHINSQIETIT